MPANGTLDTHQISNNSEANALAYGSFIIGIIACIAAWLILIKAIVRCIQARRKGRRESGSLLPLHDLHAVTTAGSLGIVNYYYHHHYSYKC